MEEKQIETTYLVYPDANALPAQYSKLLDRAKASLKDSWSPYSEYKVAAAVELANGQIFTGANQENAAYPLCLCAERVALAAAASKCPNIPPIAMAITTEKGDSPAAPCGACRQVISEQEFRFDQPITLILGAQRGNVMVLDSVQPLLPFSFHGALLKG
ncbi:MAG: cytidine deaminase [Saprospiraceae bacterium]|nr:cytidine deaminase [Saprospiraceae bacterium]